MAQKIKLSTIAEALNVSTATVSLALRDSPLVADATRERIKEHARTIGYIYNRRAASLRTSRSGIVGVVVHDIMNPFFAEILRSIESELDRSRQTFLLSNHYDQLEKQRTFIDTLLQLGADGVIMSPAIGTPAADIQLAEANGLPAVLIARSVEDADVPVFRGDDAYGIGLATNHLISLGHRRIAMIGGTDQTSTGRDRYRGYVMAMEAAGLPVETRWRIPGPRTKQAGFEASQQFLALKDKPTAAVCWNDLVAIGLMNGIARAGLVPGVDVSVTGYDDLEEAAIATPALTTVWNGQREVGRRAARTLLDRLNGVEVHGGQELIRPELHVRQSTGKPVER
ncbi:MAG: LacI family DNA-binding transcriptional regulator [Neoaquamicrobium sediminum]|uniref:LacI family DNA-binding transcriptional regulator n=1 Tax=Neoaquamicrobium sediminum TaxID=1849104 RepID=A0ABV3WV43_9HYPH|nr:LacI family DNA-binding transcriptional regulator [Mesorhizobium sediminum]MBX9453384.1 substrate-binding domain-containing protein [Mesorhizobium sp.]MBX9465812.1 substrate-binding domain-containing protein [Aquamicrobium sp.]NRC56167.1 LacI family DNA-binding transcriptional regulator [Mesorhizobium sediminum]